jgi:malonate decarboxylase delta subunit
MLTLKFSHAAKRRLAGKQATAIIGVVASGNLEVLLERVCSPSVPLRQIEGLREGRISGSS